MFTSKHRLKSTYLSAAAAIAIGLLAAPTVSFAHGGGIGNGGVGGGMGGGASGSANNSSNMSNTGFSASGSANGSANVPHESIPDMTPNGGQSASHISKNGLINTNGPNAADRQLGGHRASLRHKLHSAGSNWTPGRYHTETMTPASSTINATGHASKRSNLQNTSTITTGAANNASTPNGGQSASNMSAQGLANTNGPNATNRAFGKARAKQRSNLTNTSMPLPKAKPSSTTPE